MLKLFRVLIVLIVAVKLEPVSSQKEPCEDTGNKCDKFAPEYCLKNKRVMVTCKKSCGLCDPNPPGNSTCARGNPSAIISSRKQDCLTENDEIMERDLFDLSHNCSEFGPDCQFKRDAAAKLVSRYYQIAEQQKSKLHKWKGTLAYGISADDPRPNGVDKYIDYLNERTTPNKPPHGYYGKLPINEIRDPTCNELRQSLHRMCGDRDQPLGDWGRDGVTMSQLCGMGTTWNPEIQKCTRIPDEYITLDGRGRPYAQPVYPTIRSRTFKSIFDEPNDKYVYLDEDEINGLTSRVRNGIKCIPTFPGGSCTSKRCRFPLTSKEGRHQAMLYVRLWRLIYEYKMPNIEDADEDTMKREQLKMVYKLKIRTLIDSHQIWFRNTIHDGDFLPWHRWYILEMESLLIEYQEKFYKPKTCNETFHGIPYFDWHNLKGNQSLKNFINDANDEFGHHFNDSLGQSTNPVKGCINQGALAGLRTTTNECLSRDWQDKPAEDKPEEELHPMFKLATEFNEFQYKLLADPGYHASVHNYIGGVMGNQRSANDPIFFTHHANVDKIWGDWQKQSCDHKNAFVGDTARDSFLIASTATPADMLHLDNLIYTPQGGAKENISVSYVDFDTSVGDGNWGDGNTISIKQSSITLP